MSTRDRYDDDEGEWSENIDYVENRDVPDSAKRRTKGGDYSVSYGTKNHNPNDSQCKDYPRSLERKDSGDDPNYPPSESSGSWATPEPVSKPKGSNRMTAGAGTRESSPEVKFHKDDDSDDNNPEKLLSGNTQIIPSAVRVVRFEPTDSKLGIQFGLKTSRFTGPLVTIASVEEYSLADESGIKEDWVLTHLDGEPIDVNTAEDFNEFILDVARKRSQGLILSFNTLLLPRLKRRMMTTDTVEPRAATTPERRNSSSSQENENVRRRLEKAMRTAKRKNGSDLSLMELRTAIEQARKLDISIRREEDELKMMELAGMFKKLAKWQDPEHAKDMTEYEKEITDLEGRISNLQSAVQRARNLHLSSEDERSVEDARTTIWKLKRIYKYCKKLGPLSKETRFFLLRIQEIYLEFDQMQGSRAMVNRVRDLKKKVGNAVRNAIDSQKPIALKVSIALGKKTNVETSFIQEVLDVIEGITEQSLKQNTKMMYRSADDAEKLNIDCVHVKELATFLDTQRISVIVRSFDKSDRGETPGRSSKRRKSRNDQPQHEWEFDMLTFNTVQDLKLQVSKEYESAYFAQHWRFDGEELVDDLQTLEQVGIVDGSKVDVIITDHLKERWVIKELIENLVRAEDTLGEEMEDTKNDLICAIQDQDFNNFLRFSSLLRKQWCNQSALKETRETLKENAERYDRQKLKESRRNQQYRSRNHTSAGSDDYPRKYERDRNPNDDYARQRESPRDDRLFYSSRYNQKYSFRSSSNRNHSPPPSPTEPNYRNCDKYNRFYAGARASPRKEWDEF